MRISDRRHFPEKVQFHTLSNGDVFDYGGVIHMVLGPITNPLGSVVCNAVKLETGAIVRFGNGDMVAPVHPILVIEDSEPKEKPTKKESVFLVMAGCTTDEHVHSIHTSKQSAEEELNRMLNDKYGKQAEPWIEEWNLDEVLT